MSSLDTDKRNNDNASSPAAQSHQANGEVVRRPSSDRVVGLDGLRGLAALYVVMFHCRLLTFLGFPKNSGPTWLGCLMYGRLAVVFFLALSGFSLALSPAASDWHLGSAARFAHRRAWRILPTYWAALAISLLIAWAVVPASHSGPPTGQSVIVYSLMLQDLVSAPTPNGAFWSIAVEVELYIVFPLIVLARRRLGAIGLLAIFFLPLVGIGLLADNATPLEGMNRLAPNLAPVFVTGAVAAGVTTATEGIRHLPWQWMSLLAGAPVLALILFHGSAWTVRHYFWIDLAVVPSMVLLIIAVATGRAAIMQRALNMAPMRILGSFSYSLYLIHLPIVMMVNRRLAVPHFGHGVSAFWLTLAVSLPLSLPSAWIFALVFEIPFQRYRSWAQLVSAWAAGLGRFRQLPFVEHNAGPQDDGDALTRRDERETAVYTDR